MTGLSPSLAVYRFKLEVLTEPIQTWTKGASKIQGPLVTSDNRRGGIDAIKYDWFLFPFAEVIHLPLLPNEGGTPFF